MSFERETYPCWAVIGDQGDPPVAVFAAQELEAAQEFARERKLPLYQAAAFAVNVCLIREWTK